MTQDLVTGGAGFIGSHLVDRLLAQGRKVRVLDSFEIGRRANLRQHAGNPRLDIVDGDVANGAAVAAAMERISPCRPGRHRTFDPAASSQQPAAYFPGQWHDIDEGRSGAQLRERGGHGATPLSPRNLLHLRKPCSSLVPPVALRRANCGTS